MVGCRILFGDFGCGCGCACGCAYDMKCDVKFMSARLSDITERREEVRGGLVDSGSKFS